MVRRVLARAVLRYACVHFCMNVQHAQDVCVCSIANTHIHQLTEPCFTPAPPSLCHSYFGVLVCAPFWSSSLCHVPFSSSFAGRREVVGSFSTDGSLAPWDAAEAGAARGGLSLSSTSSATLPGAARWTTHSRFGRSSWFAPLQVHSFDCDTTDLGFFG